jgi:hypothetical protein
MFYVRIVQQYVYCQIFQRKKRKKDEGPAVIYDRFG